ncbi:MAG: MFS transporter [Sedimentisphaerales bacterium]|nr:MFS transporter [Sedimentisphaerales bacterium]
MSVESKRFQWGQLLALTVVHGLLDVPPGIIHVVLPEIQREFAISITLGGVLLGVFNLTCNGVQVLTGHWRAGSDRPRFQYIGLVLCVALSLFALLPRDSTMFPVLVFLAVVAGCGVAMPHPEALRAVHAIDKVPAPIATGVYMAGGIAGFCVGGWFSPRLLDAFGLKGLYVFLLTPMIGIPLLASMRIRLAVETPLLDENGKRRPRPGLISFWPVLLMTALAGISSAILVWLLPQKLGSLSGGKAVTLFMVGGGAGSFVLAWLAHKIGEVRCATLGMLGAICLLVPFLIFIDRRWTYLLLFPAGMLGYGAYPVLVTLAKNARGPNFGTRMGLIVGGVWGIASVATMALAPVADRIGVDAVLQCSPIGFMLALVAGIIVLRRTGGPVKPMEPTTFAAVEPL